MSPPYAPLTHTSTVTFLALGFTDLFMGMSLLSSHESIKHRDLASFISISPALKGSLAEAQLVFVELVDWFMASPLGPPPSGHCKYENSWVILGL